ncbi:MAG: PaaX family transcriptional regulator C-terminal domain-containing protein [Candidatus Promineifilaceae bacterium]
MILFTFLTLVTKIHNEINLSNNSRCKETCFQECFQLTYEFQPSPRTDSNLPVVLLSVHWSGHQARQIFTNYRHHLSQGLPKFIANLSG